MRIGIDARLYGPVAKGLGRYVSELIASLEQVDQENEYVVFLRACNYDEYVPKNPRFRKVLAEHQWYGWREQVLFPLQLLRHRLDLVHFPHFNVPLLYPRPFVVSIHDLILLTFPTTRATTLGPLLYRLKYLAYRLVIGHAATAARAVITMSKYSRQDLLKNFPAVKQNRLHVTYQAVSDRLTATPAEIPARAAALIQPFALYVGNGYPHKNLELLISAFHEFRAGHHDWRLVLVGADDYFYRRLTEHAVRVGAAEEVNFFGRATDEELAALYARASLYVFPSLYEGFGLPPLEAMCHGVPVLSSDATCLPEVLGDAAQYFDGHDQHALAMAMGRLAGDDATRADLVARGRRQCALYSWHRLGEETLQIYRDALNR
jgi:glycosyltransferase involved in cell wall biosynthesis